MRNILFISEYGSAKALASRVQSAGDRIALHIEDQTEGKLFINGFFNPETLRYMAKSSPDVAILDANFEASPAIRIEFEKSGIPVYGSSLIAKSARNNPAYIVKVLNLNGIKTQGATQNAVKAVYSVVISGRKLCSSFLSFEYARLMNGDVGPEAAMGSINYHGDLSRLDEKFRQLIQSIAGSNFSGKLDFLINLAQDDLWCEGVHFYFKWNNLYAFLENINLAPGEFFYKCALNQEMELKPRSPWSCQITAAVPPFPYPLLKNEETALTGLDANNGKHTWLSNLQTGELFTVSSRGDYVREAKRRAYRTLSNLSAKDMMYRTDIGDDIIGKCRTLRTYGWLDIPEEALIEPFKAKLSPQAA